jgi:hypothetical protein
MEGIPQLRYAEMANLFGKEDDKPCDLGCPSFITQDAKFRKYVFTILIWFLIRLEDMNLIRFEFGVMISIWFCYVFDMVWVMA